MPLPLLSKILDTWVLSKQLHHIMTQISKAQRAALAGLLEAIHPSSNGHKVDQFELEDDIEGEQEALPDYEGPSQISDVLNTVGEVSRAVKDKTDVEYRRWADWSSF
jgi:hypothetical protein